MKIILQLSIFSISLCFLSNNAYSLDNMRKKLGIGNSYAPAKISHTSTQEKIIYLDYQEPDDTEVNAQTENQITPSHDLLSTPHDGRYSFASTDSGATDRDSFASTKATERASTTSNSRARPSFLNDISVRPQLKKADIAETTANANLSLSFTQKLVSSEKIVPEKKTTQQPVKSAETTMRPSFLDAIKAGSLLKKADTTEAKAKTSLSLSVTQNFGTLEIAPEEKTIRQLVVNNIKGNNSQKNAEPILLDMINNSRKSLKASSYVKLPVSSTESKPNPYANILKKASMSNTRVTSSESGK
ncbi:MAG: hypothetical protein V4544_06190 [Pseudomonadota bacterium]